VDRSFLYGFIDHRESLLKKFLGQVFVFILDRLSQFFYLRAKDRFVAPVYRVPTEAVSPLALR
jgi:hypothetical protein